ncbi:MAG: PilZ domain-containing protein [Chlamydiota bacterium]
MESPRSSLEHTPTGDAAFPQPVDPIANAGKPLPLSGPERRARVRVLSQLPLSVKFGGIYETMAESANLSARGMFFVLQQRLEVGSVVELIFRLPRRVIGVDGVWLRCPAEVVRLQEGLPEGKFGIGARITSYDVFRVS